MMKKILVGLVAFSVLVVGGVGIALATLPDPIIMDKVDSSKAEDHLKDEYKASKKEVATPLKYGPEQDKSIKPKADKTVALPEVKEEAPVVTPEEVVETPAVVEQEVAPGSVAPSAESEASYVAPVVEQEVPVVEAAPAPAVPNAPVPEVAAPSTPTPSPEETVMLSQSEAIQFLLQQIGMDATDKLFMVDSVDPHTFYIEVRAKAPAGQSHTSLVGAWAIQRVNPSIHQLY